MGVAACSQLYALVTVVLWSSAYVFTKLALAYFSPGVLSLLRCGVAALLFAALAAAGGVAVRASGICRCLRFPACAASRSIR